MIDNYERDVAVYKSIRTKLILACIITPFVIYTVIMLGVIIAATIYEANIGINLNYTCVGVEKEWLDNHPFDTTGFPTKIKYNETITLEAPEIENYIFEAWYVGNSSEPWEGNSFKFQDLNTSDLYSTTFWSVSFELHAHYHPAVK